MKISYCSTHFLIEMYVQRYELKRERIAHCLKGGTLIGRTRQRAFELEAA